MVGVTDLLLLLGFWGPCPNGLCRIDFDIDGTLSVSDLLILLAHWGDCP